MQLPQFRLALPFAALAWGCAAGPKSTDSLPEGPAGEFSSDISATNASESPDVARRDRAPRPPNVIYRAEIDRATGGGKPGYLLRELAPEAYRPRGAREGWVIGSVFPNDPGLCADHCDLYPGDIILTVNGNPLERPEQLSELMSQVETMTTLEVRLVRDGKLHERSYEILDEAKPV